MSDVVRTQRIGYFQKVGAPEPAYFLDREYLADGTRRLKTSPWADETKATEIAAIERTGSMSITLIGVPEDQLVGLLCPSCRKQASCPLMEGGRFVCGLCGWEGHQDELLAEQAEETRATPERVSSPPSGPPGGELHEPILDGNFSTQVRLDGLERAMRHLADWYTEYKVPIRETTFWKNEVLPLLTK